MDCISGTVVKLHFRKTHMSNKKKLIDVTFVYITHIYESVVWYMHAYIGVCCMYRCYLHASHVFICCLYDIIHFEHHVFVVHFILPSNFHNLTNSYGVTGWKPAQYREAPTSIYLQRLHKRAIHIFANFAAVENVTNPTRTVSIIYHMKRNLNEWIRTLDGRVGGCGGGGRQRMRVGGGGQRRFGKVSTTPAVYGSRVLTELASWDYGGPLDDVLGDVCTLAWLRNEVYAGWPVWPIWLWKPFS